MVSIGSNLELAKLWDAHKSDESINAILSHKPTVILHHNNEAGLWQWSIALAETSLWLDSFPNKSKALSYARKHRLPYTIADDKLRSSVMDRLPTNFRLPNTENFY